MQVQARSLLSGPELLNGISGNVIYVAAGAKPIALYTNAQTEIWKGTMFHDLSQVVVGDNITARYPHRRVQQVYRGRFGSISRTFTPSLPKLQAAALGVLTNPNADPQSAYRKENKSIEVDANTSIESCAREDLKQGRDVQVVGLVPGNGDIRATRVTVYEGGGQCGCVGTC